MTFPSGVTRRHLLVLVLCLVAVVLAVQLADPFEGSHSSAPHPKPDASADAVETLRYSFSLLNGTSYTLDVILVNETGGRNHYWHSEINYTERELYFRGGTNTTYTQYYLNPNGGWMKPIAGEWRHLGVTDAENRFFSETIPRPFDGAKLHDGNTRIVDRSDGILRIRVEGTGQNTLTKPIPDRDRYTIYELDAETYRLQRAVEYRSTDDGTARSIYLVSDYGRTTVTRPDGTKNAFLEIAGDLFR